MNERQDLLNAIIESPDDDAPRLIYADWLDENEEPERAEFIRVQCEIEDFIRLGAHEPPNSNCNVTGICGNCNREADVRQLRKREQELLSTTRKGFVWWNRIEWCNEIKADFWDKSTFRRGFIDEVRLTLAQFMEHAKEIAKQHPVRKWVLTDVKAWQSTEDADNDYCLWDHSGFGGSIEPEYGDIPSSLFEGLEGFIKKDNDYCSYATEQELFSALQNACFRYARSEISYAVPNLALS